MFNLKKKKKVLHEDLIRRWLQDLDLNEKRNFAISALLHPLFKDYSFIDQFDFVDSADKQWALRELRAEWLKWKSLGSPPQQAPQQASLVPPSPLVPSSLAALQPAPALPREPQPIYKKERKVTLGNLLLMPIKKEESEKQPELDELDQYMKLAPETDPDVDVLDWWQKREHIWPKLTRMVKQFLAAPASSAGVERKFSAAGKMHDDLKKSTNDTLLENSLFAAFNTE
jgi:hypothetical protein